jgi:hypothetical protein
VNDPPARARLPVVLVLVLALGGVACGGSRASPPPRPGEVVLRDGFSHPNGPNDLIANEWSSSNPTDPRRVRSAIWTVTSGSLFSHGGHGWTGIPDGLPPDRYSTTSTDSETFRLHTVREDFGDVEQEVDVRINRFTQPTTGAAHGWDGVVLWPRYVTQFHLYFAYLLRKDGRVAITKKCPGSVPGGGFYNGGTYFELAPVRSLRPPVVGRWYHLASAVQDNPGGSVTIRVFRDGVLVARATDYGVGCPPIRGPAKLGIRSDDVDASFDNYAVTGLSASLPRRYAGSLVGAKRQAALRHSGGGGGSRSVGEGKTAPRQ